MTHNTINRPHQTVDPDDTCCFARLNDRNNCARLVQCLLRYPIEIIIINTDDCSGKFQKFHRISGLKLLIAAFDASSAYPAGAMQIV